MAGIEGYLPNGRPIPGYKKKKKKKPQPTTTPHGVPIVRSGQGYKPSPPKPQKPSYQQPRPEIPTISRSIFDQPDATEANVKNLTLAWKEKYGTKPTAQAAMEMMASANKPMTVKEWAELLAPGLAEDTFTARMMRISRIYLSRTGQLPSPDKMQAIMAAKNPDEAAQLATNAPSADDIPLWGPVINPASKEAGARLNRPGQKWSKKDLVRLGRIMDVKETVSEADKARELANTTIHGNEMSLAMQEKIWDARGWYMPTSLKKRILARQNSLVNDDGTFNEDTIKMFSISTGQNNGNMKDPGSFAYIVNRLGGKPRSVLTNKQKADVDSIAAFLQDVYPDEYKLKKGEKPIFDEDMYKFAARYLMESSLPTILSNYEVDGNPVVSAEEKAIAMINLSVATGGKIKPEDNVYQWLTEARMLGSADQMYSDKLAGYLLDAYCRTTGRNSSIEMNISGFANLMGEESLPREYGNMKPREILKEVRGQFSNIYVAMDAEAQQNRTGVPNILTALSAGVLADIKVMSDYQSGVTNINPARARQFIEDPNSFTAKWSAVRKESVKRYGRAVQIKNQDPFDPVARWVDEEFVPTVGGITLSFLDNVERLKNQVFLTFALMGRGSAGFHANIFSQIGEMSGESKKHEAIAAVLPDVRIPTSVDAYSWHSIRNSWSEAHKRVNAGGDYLSENPYDNIFEKAKTTFSEDPSRFTFGNRAYMESQFKYYGLDPKEHQTLLFWTDMAWSLSLDLLLDAGVKVVSTMAKQTAAQIAFRTLSPKLQEEVSIAKKVLATTRSATRADQEVFRASYKALRDKAARAEAAGFSEIAGDYSVEAERLLKETTEAYKAARTTRKQQSKVLELLNRPRWYDPYAYGLSKGTQKDWQIQRIMNVKTHGIKDVQKLKDIKRITKFIGQSHDSDLILKGMNELRLLGVKLDPGEIWLGKTRNYAKWFDGDKYAAAKHLFPDEERVINGAIRTDDMVESLGMLSNMGLLRASRQEAQDRIGHYMQRLFDVPVGTIESMNYQRQQIWREFTDEIVANMKNVEVSDDMLDSIRKWGNANGFDVSDLSHIKNNWDAYQAFRKIKQHKGVSKRLDFGREKKLPVYAVNDENMPINEVEFLPSVRGENGARTSGQMSKDLVAPFNMQDLVSFQRGRASMEMWMHTGFVFGVGPSWMGAVNATKTLAIANMAFPISAFFIDEFYRFPVEYARGHMGFNPKAYIALRKQLKATGRLREVGGDVITSMLGRAKTLVPVGPEHPMYYKWLNAFNVMFEKNDFFRDFKQFIDEFPQAADETDEMFKERFFNFLVDRVSEQSEEGELLRLHMAQTHRGFDGPNMPGPEVRELATQYDETRNMLEDDMKRHVDALNGEDGNGGLRADRAAFNDQTVTRTIPPKRSKVLPYSEAQLEVFPEYTLAGKANKEVWNANLRWLNNPTSANFENLRNVIAKDLQRKIDAITKEVGGIRQALKDEAAPTTLKGMPPGGAALSAVDDAEVAMDVLRKNTAKMADDELSQARTKMDEVLNQTKEELDKLKKADRDRIAAEKAAALADEVSPEPTAPAGTNAEEVIDAETGGIVGELVTPKTNPFKGTFPEKSAPDGLIQVVDDFMVIPDTAHFNSAKQQILDFYSDKLRALNKRIKQMEDDDIRGIVQDNVLIQKYKEARTAFEAKFDEVDGMKYRERRVGGRKRDIELPGENDDAIATTERKIKGIERSMKSNIKLGLEDLNRTEQKKLDRLTDWLKTLKDTNKPIQPKAPKPSAKPKPTPKPEPKPDPKVKKLEKRVATLQTKLQQIQDILSERQAAQVAPEIEVPEASGALELASGLPAGEAVITKPKPNMSPAGVKRLQAKIRALKKQLAALDDETLPAKDVIDYGPTQKNTKLGTLLDVKRPESKRWKADWFRYRHRSGLETYMGHVFNVAEGSRKATDDEILQAFGRLPREQQEEMLEQMKWDWRAEVYETKGVTEYAAQRDMMDKAIKAEEDMLATAKGKLDEHLSVRRPDINIDNNTKEWLQRSVDRLFTWNGIPELWDAAVNGKNLSKRQVDAIQARLVAENRTLPVVIGADNAHAGLWGSGSWWRNTGEYGRIPIINKLAEIGPYKVLDALSNATRNHAYVSRMMVELDELERLGFKRTADETVEMAHYRALDYTDDVMYSNGRTPVEQDTRGLFMFMPAYRQAIQYWGRELGRNPFFYMGLRNKINSDFPMEYAGDYGTMIPMPFWAQGNLAEAAVPGLVPPILFPLRVINTMSGWQEVEVKDSESSSHKEWQYTGNTKFDWMAEGKVVNMLTGFASKNVSPLSFVDEFLWGIAGDNQFVMPTSAPNRAVSVMLSAGLAMRKDPMARRKAAMNIYAAQVARGMKPDISVAEAQIAGSPWWFNLMQSTGFISHPEGIFKGLTGLVSPRKITYSPSDIGEIVYGPDDNREITDIWGLIAADEEARTIADAEWLYLKAETTEEKQAVLDKYPKYKKIVEFRTFDAYERAQYLADPKNRGKDSILPYVGSRNEYTPGGKLLMGDDYYTALRKGMVRKKDMYEFIASLQKLNINAQWDQVRLKLDEKKKADDKAATALLRKAAKEMATTPQQYQDYLADIERFKNGWLDKPSPTQYKSLPIEPLNWMTAWAYKHKLDKKPWKWNLQAINDNYWDSLAELGADTTETSPEIIAALREQGVRIPKTDNEKAQRPEGANMGGVESLYSNPRVKNWDLEHGVGGMNRIADSLTELMSPEDRSLFDLRGSMSHHDIKEENKKNAAYRKYLTLKYASQEYWKFVGVQQLKSIGVPVKDERKMVGLFQTLDNLYALKQKKGEGLSTSSDEYKAVLKWYKGAYKQALSPDWAAPLREGPARRLMYTYLVNPGARAKLNTNYISMAVGQMGAKKPNFDFIIHSYRDGGNSNGNADKHASATAWATVLGTAITYRNKMANTYNEWGDYSGVTPDSKAGEPYVNRLTRLVYEWKKRSPLFKHSWEDLGGDTMISTFLDYGS